MNGDAPNSGPHADACLPFILADGAFRGRVIRLNETADVILKRHDYPEAVSRALAEAMVLCVALASGLKYEGIFTLQTSGDGVIKTLLVDYQSSGALRAYASYDRDALGALDADEFMSRGDWVPRLLGQGYLAFTVDQGPDTERYQGIVALEGGTLAQCMHTYFRDSEQLEAAVKVAVSAPTDTEGWRTAGVLIQRMPEDGGVKIVRDEADLDEAWRTSVILMAHAEPAELLDDALDPLRLVNRLYGAEGARVATPKPIRDECRCSRARVARAVATLGEDDIQEVMKDGSVTMTCEFCKTEYVFTVQDLKSEDI